MLDKLNLDNDIIENKKKVNDNTRIIQIPFISDSQTNIKIAEFDLNKIFEFNFSYNFELLKNLIETLIKKQNQNHDEFLNFKKNNESKTKGFENEITSLKNSIDSMQLSINISKSKNIDTIDKDKDTQEKKEFENIINNIDKSYQDKINSINEKITHLDEVVNLISKELDIKPSSNDTYLNKGNINFSKIKPKDFAKITNEIKENITNLENTINNKIKEDKVKEKEYNETMEEMKKNFHLKIKEVLKLSVQNEKFCQSLPEQSWIIDIKDDINNIKECIKNYALSTDLILFRCKNEQFEKDINSLREQYQELESIKNLNKEVYNLRKKFEISVISMKELENFQQNLSTKINQLINSKSLKDEIYKNLLEKKEFEDFKSKFQKEFKNINNNCINMRKLIDNSLDEVKDKITFNELKAFESEFNAKLDEMKVSSLKKFADQIETNKNIKYLNQQIKNISQSYKRQFEKSDSWILAKKPINSNICASCESFIGDLKNNNQYIPWNKYPLKDLNDQTYKFGNGYSKMLQMIDESDKKNNINNNLKELKINNVKEYNNDLDFIGENNQYLKTMMNNWFNMNKNNLPKIKKGHLTKNKSGINLSGIKSTNNIGDNDNLNIDNFPDNDSEILNKNNFILFSEGDKNDISPRITKIKKIIKSE